MPLTEINVTNPPPVYANYWREREAARLAAPPPPPWPAVDPRPAGGGPSQAARLPPDSLPAPVAGVGERRRAVGGLVGGLRGAGPAGFRRRPVRPGLTAGARLSERKGLGAGSPRLLVLLQ
jgi:hypothetical protein